MRIPIVSIVLLIAVSAGASASDLGGVKLGAPSFSAIMLHNDGCRRLERDDHSNKTELDRVFDPGTSALALANMWTLEADLGIDLLDRASTVEQIEYICKDRRQYSITIEKAEPQRVMGVTLLYCSGDEQEGEKVLYRKLGREWPEGFQGSGMPDASLFKNDEFQTFETASAPWAPAVPKHVAVTAYKAREGCIVEGVGKAFMFGLSFYAKDLYAEVSSRSTALKKKRINTVKPPAQL
ncbi:hypothetical protein [Hyphomicrobium sp.]|uniref:hypothetical protein n=1 Tax=Hyphomicrobium sp. TaxID=82 RepID=UPI002E303E64|nr:hypothetical protein [Hyphomicrobium sp.]HEX2842138.1 hypothetical protein [Hyphomicrobium sp.]